MNGETNLVRRALLKTTALASTVGAFSGIPLVSYVIAPALKKGTRTWFDFGPVEKLGRGGVTMLSYRLMLKDGWVVLPKKGILWGKTQPDGGLTVFSATCPHLGCSVIWREEEKSFECPCHSGRFDENGRPVAGPPTKPLAVLDYRVENGNLLVLLPA